LGLKYVIFYEYIINIMPETIFVQIASYRDPELIPTIKDILEKAKHPENLYFGICWQHGPEETLYEYINNPQFRIIDVHWRESKGLGWARSAIQKLYNGETYTLQLDSHHRFVKNWDKMLIKMVKELQKNGHSKPIITTYAGVYDPTDPRIYIDSRPFKMVGEKFSPYGTILFFPHPIEDADNLNKPIPARFVSGHFFFTVGQHCIEYKYDPDIYFAGDEISLSIRSYTLGYDLFHPHRLVLYHEYTRKYRTKHWDDHVDTNKEKIDTLWHERDNYSKKRLRQLLQEEDNGIDLGEYGLGTVRTHHDYEVYAGINFKYRQLHKYTIEGRNPPNPKCDDDWYLISDNKYTVSIKWNKNDFDPNNNYQFWYFGIEDEKGSVLYREDIDFDSNKHLLLESCEKTFLLNLPKNTNPYKWIIWPYDKTNNWLEKKEHIIKSTELNKI
jgi:hypothetical protein